MNAKRRLRLERHRANYESIEGRAFNYFYCPILFVDEDIPLIGGHVVNKEFKGCPRKWAIQRGNVDGFFGRYFESEFVDFQYMIALRPWIISLTAPY